MAETQLEVWLRGAQNEFPVLLQPIAFALQQAQEDVHKYTVNFPDQLLFERPGGAASPAFHLQHLTGVLDRMFTYAEGKVLSEEQLNWLNSEGKNRDFSVQQLVEIFDTQIEISLQKLKRIDTKTLTEPRGVGRKQLPSTVFGLLLHAAEHTQRHVGQLLVTVKVLMNAEK
ncbi:MAG: DinB family protein [Janthinobacterium lividum]